MTDRSPGNGGGYPLPSSYRALAASLGQSDTYLGERSSIGHGVETLAMTFPLPRRTGHPGSPRRRAWSLPQPRPVRRNHRGRLLRH